MSDSDKEKVNQASRTLAFIFRHPFELLAVTISLIGILGYAAGASFNDGWSHAAGLPPSFFQSAPYETILTGLSLYTPWLYSAIGLAIICAEIWLIACLDAWQERRNSLVRIRRKVFETRDNRETRRSLANAARNERKLLTAANRKKGEAYRKWKELRNRGHWRTIADSKNKRFARNHRYIRSTAYLIMQLACIFMAGGFYVFAKTLIVKQASSEGANQFVSLYSAVTGALPSQFTQKSVSDQKLLEFACQGRSELWKYRAVSLKIDNQKEVSTWYILQGTDKLFLLLSQSGSAIHSFGSGSYTLAEAPIRPISELAKSCPK